MPEGYQHVTRDLRCQIYSLLTRGLSIREIGRQLGLAPSTVSREVRRNSGIKGYSIEEADSKATERRSQASSVPRKFVGKVKSYVISGLNRCWSPEQISGRLEAEGKETVSVESIYRFIRLDKKQGGLLYEDLRHRGKPYNKRLSLTSGRGCIPNRVDIDERPKIVEKKSRIGDWEGDTIIGAGHKGVILTLVDRHSKYLVAENIGNKTMESAEKAIINSMSRFQNKVHTITFDNGKEFACHERVSQALNAKCYFAKPYHSWERGLNEHTNGLIRQYLPKGTDLTMVSNKMLKKIVEDINNRPRKVLGYMTPAEVFNSKANKSSVALHC